MLTSYGALGLGVTVLRAKSVYSSFPHDHLFSMSTELQTPFLHNRRPITSEERIRIVLEKRWNDF